MILLVGILLTVIALPTGSDRSKGLGSAGEEEESGLTEKEKLERNLEKMLSNMEGVGQVQVLLTMEETKDLFTGKSKSGQVQGVLIVAQGADNPVIVHNIQQSVMALFQVEAHKIRIMKMK